MQRTLIFNKEQTKDTMQKGGILGTQISFATFGENQQSVITTKELGFTDESLKTPVGKEEIFGAASLSKPVFAYLVLKLIESGEYGFDLKTNLNDILPFEKFCEENKFEWHPTEEDIKRVKLLNAKMVLSHTTGLDLPKLDFQFEPGEGYRYSGLPIFYLQKVLEAKTGKTLEALAKKYVFDPIGMKHSSFYPDFHQYELGLISDPKRKRGKIYLNATEHGLQYQMIAPDGELKKQFIPWDDLPKDFLRNLSDITQSKEKYLSAILDHTSKVGYTKPAVSANSLFTTAEDYANFVVAWMNDTALTYAFEPVIQMMEKDGKINDKWAHALKVSPNDMKHIASGLGWDLETNDQDKVIRAYKTGDMDPWRGQVAIDFEKKTVTVFFANSKNGHLLADHIISPNIELKHGFNYFFPKFGFARKIENDWEKKEKERFNEIDTYVKLSVLPDWQKSLISSLYNSVKNNYIFSEKIEETVFKKMLIDHFFVINLKHPPADKQTVCSEINKVLKNIDPHLILQYDPNQISDHMKNKRIIDDPRKNNCASFKLDGLEAPASWHEKFKKENYGFREKPEHLQIPEDMGYIKINDFLDPDRDKLGSLAKEKAGDILKNMQGKKAIILDLRDSHGGAPEMVEFILSYLLTKADKEKIKEGTYNTIYDRSTEQTKEYKAKPTDFTLNVPVYVLTNEATFSAAEEFAYDLQQLNKHVLKDDRFVIMGQTTRGGAHAMTGFPLMDSESKEINSDYFLWVPTRVTINPYTHTNWEDGPKKEGKKPGVQPDVEIPKNQDALKIAVRHYEKSISKKSLQSTVTVAKKLNINPSLPVQQQDEKKKVTEKITQKENPVPQGNPVVEGTLYKTPTLTRDTKKK